MARKTVRKKKPAPKAVPKAVPAPAPGEIIYQNDPRFPYTVVHHEIQADANQWHKMLTRRLTLLERFSMWFVAHEPRITFWFWLTAVAVASWWLSSVYSGLVVAEACREVAAFELFGRVYACGLGQ